MTFIHLFVADTSQSQWRSWEGGFLVYFKLAVDKDYKPPPPSVRNTDSVACHGRLHSASVTTEMTSYSGVIWYFWEGKELPYISMAIRPLNWGASLYLCSLDNVICVIGHIKQVCDFYGPKSSKPGRFLCPFFLFPPSLRLSFHANSLCHEKLLNKKKQVRLVSVKAECPNHPSRSRARQVG